MPEQPIATKQHAEMGARGLKLTSLLHPLSLKRGLGPSQGWVHKLEGDMGCFW